MKVHFCDLCNESVPQADIEQGRAILRKGRIICMNCDRAMSRASSPTGVTASDEAEIQAGAEAAPSAPATALSETAALAAREPVAGPLAASFPMSSASAVAGAPPAVAASSSSAGLWMAVLGLLFTAGAIAVFHDRIEKLYEENRREDQLLNRHADFIRGAARVPQMVADGQRTLEQDLARRLGDEGARVQRELEDVRDQARTQSAELATLKETLAALRADAGATDSDRELRLAALSARIAKNEDDQRQQLDRLALLEEAQKNAATVAAAAAAKAESPPVASGPTWTNLVADLSSPSSGTRWEAVNALGQSKDPEVVPLLVPMLKDADVFVRMATARVLGDLNAPPGVPALIDALEDQEAAVREAALVALRQITGKDLRFDPLANEAERAKKVKAWRDWWKKTEEEGGLSRG